MIGQWVYIPGAGRFGRVEARLGRDCGSGEDVYRVRLDCGCCTAPLLGSQVMTVGAATPELIARCTAGGSA